MMEGKSINLTIIDESVSTCVISTSYWLALGSSTLSPLLNSLETFDGHTFIPKGYLTKYPITLGGKNVMMISKS